MNTTQSQSEPNIEADATDSAGQSGQESQHSTAGPGSTWSGGSGSSGLPGLDQLRRPVNERMIAGVASGIARYLGVDTNIVRIAFVVLTFVGGAALPLYVAGWLLIPEDGADQSIAGELFSSVENRSR
jgi:phage shock protein PspC (stress-responsive transcriptional regulator)